MSKSPVSPAKVLRGRNRRIYGNMFKYMCQDLQPRRHFYSSDIADLFPSESLLYTTAVSIPELDHQEVVPFGVRPFNAPDFDNLLLSLFDFLWLC